jgi:hypothetical protein
VILLAPLAAGPHTIHTTATVNGTTTCDHTYNLTVE